MHTVDPGELEQFVGAILEGVGASPAIADRVADSLVAADLRGQHSHGVFRVPQYIRGIEELGEINPDATSEIVRETPVSAVIDGNYQFGQVCGQRALDLAVRKAEEVGIGVVGIRDATHLGRIGEWAERATESGYLGMFQVAAQGGTETVAPAGSADRRYSTNPIAFGVPTFDALEFPLVLDMATSQVAHGKIRTLAENDEPIPEGWTIGADGEPVTDARAFVEDKEGALLPLGGLTAGYKGHGLSIVTELFAGNIGDGAVFGQQDLPRAQNIGAFYVIDPEIFTSREAFADRVEAFVAWIRSADFREDIPVGDGAKFERGLLPGEPEHRLLVERRENGVPIPDETAAALSERAMAYGATSVDPFLTG